MCGWSDFFLVSDVGILVSFDPVALDQACIDKVNAQRGNEGSMLSRESLPAGKDKIRGVYPDMPWEVTLEHAEALGMGSRAYSLLEI